MCIKPNMELIDKRIFTLINGINKYIFILGGNPMDECVNN
jgi:hypothetical protein